MPEQMSKMLVFIIASLAHVITQGNGSGADIAASSFTGMIEYTSFQAEWLLKAYKKSTSITQLIESEWKYLSIKELSLPESVQLVVGWTGSPDRKSTRLNSSHVAISYAVFCFKKKNIK